MIIQAMLKKPFRAGLVVLLGAGLLWQMAGRSFSAYMADVAPRSALRLRPDNARALMQLAAVEMQEGLGRAAGKDGAETPAPARDGTIAPNDMGDRMVTWARLAEKAGSALLALGGGPGDEAGGKKAVPMLASADSKRIYELARKALASEPLNSRALSMMGRLAILDNDTPNANLLMSKSASLSMRESVAVFWMMEQSQSKGDFVAALKYGDILLRTASRLSKYVFAVMGRIAEDEAGNVELKKLLLSNPPWRARFFGAIAKNVTDARTPLELLLAVKESENPPSVKDISVYLDFLLKRKFYELAYYTWLQFLSVDELKTAGLLANGGFEAVPTGLPFDWKVKVGAGVIADFVYRHDTNGNRALFIEFTHGRVDFGNIRQMVLLGPGRYELKGRVKGQISGRRGLRWRVVCVPKPREALGRSKMAVGMIPTWRVFTAAFTVPKSGCRAQYVELMLDARSASETLVRGTIWFDDLVLARVADVTPPPTAPAPATTQAPAPVAPVVSKPQDGAPQDPATPDPEGGVSVPKESSDTH